MYPLTGEATNPDAYTVGLGFCEIPCACCDRPYTEFALFYGLPVNCDRKIIEEMRRYLYRNVACEYRKGFADFSKMPNLPGRA
jgi:hypothetical protein